MKYDISKNEMKKRIYDKNGFCIRGCCIIWSKVNSQVLLIKNKKNKWCLPGGCIEENDYSILSGAIREVEEEAGIIGNIINFVGTFEDNDGKYKHNTYVWNMEFKEELNDYLENNRDRKWFDVIDAVNLLDHKPIQKKMLLSSLQ